MADTTILNHGYAGGATAHRSAGTPPCLPCLDAENDYRQAWRIAAGETRALRVPVEALRAVFRGADPTTALACLGGPRTLHAIREGTMLRG